MVSIDRSKFPLKQLFGVSVFAGSFSQLQDLFAAQLSREQSEIMSVAALNAEIVVQASQDEQLAHDLQQCDFALPDGMGLVFAARWSGVQLERIAGVDAVRILLEYCAEHKLPTLVIGGRGYASATAKRQLEEWGAVWLEGYANVSQPTEAEEREVAKVLRKLKPAVVFVAFGAPKQEHWIATHRSLLTESAVKIAIAVGGSFDFLLGKVVRAPRWVQNVGLEWLFRLWQEPWRWRRQLRLVQFLQIMVKKQ